MKTRTAIAAASGAVILGTGAFMLPALASPATAASHTLTFISVTGKSVMFTDANGGQQDTDLNAKGQTVGFDMLYFSVVSTSTAAVNATVDTKGGFVYATFTVNVKTGAVSKGKVTGGTGAFKGATGTLKAKQLNKSGTRTRVTITYHT